MAEVIRRKKRFYTFVRFWGNGVDLVDDQGTPHFRSRREYQELIRRGVVIEEISIEKSFG